MADKLETLKRVLEDVISLKAWLEEDIKKAEVEEAKRERVTITLSRYDLSRLTTLLVGQRGYHDLRDMLLSLDTNNYKVNGATATVKELGNASSYCRRSI